ncbi:MAG: anti-sigma-factor antagonist [Thermoleophilia bacterium]|nr:anti-sigma-factor antagonist [Thermoleophilia bacterium]
MSNDKQWSGSTPAPYTGSAIELPDPSRLDARSLELFWEAYDAHYDEVREQLLAFVSKDPIFGPIVARMDPQLQLDRDRQSRQLMRDAIVDGQWKPYLDDLVQQGRTYAQQGISFSGWFQVVSAFRGFVRPVLFQYFDDSREQLLAGLTGLHDLLDLAMSTIGETYLAEKETVIRNQQQSLLELSSPVLQIRDRLLLLPIIGVIDTVRAREITESLLAKIGELRARTVIIDITGVAAVDSQVAGHLLQTIEAARLMGAHVIVSGVSPAVAQSLVVLGVDVSRLRTVVDLQTAIDDADVFASSTGTPS